MAIEKWDFLLFFLKIYEEENIFNLKTIFENIFFKIIIPTIPFKLLSTLIIETINYYIYLAKTMKPACMYD